MKFRVVFWVGLCIGYFRIFRWTKKVDQDGLVRVFRVKPICGFLEGLDLGMKDEVVN